jgi:hypothetical protein
MAAGKPAHRQPQATRRAVGAQRLHGVLTARRGEPASGGEQRADEPLVQDNGDDKHPCRWCRHGRVCVVNVRRAHSWRSAPTCRRSSRPMTRSRSAARSAWCAPAAAGWARSTSRQPPGSEARRLRISSRSRRFTRLRTTAEPTARLTTKPTFAGSPERTAPAESAAPGAGPASSRWPASMEPPARRPVRSTRRKSSVRLILDCCGSTAPPAQRRPPGSVTRRPAWSDAQLRPALMTARGKDSTARPGTHPQPEAVDLGPPTVVRLECTLAHWSSTSAMVICYRFNGVSLLTVRGIPAQVKPASATGCPTQDGDVRTPRSGLPSWNTAVSRAHPAPAT